MGNRIKMKPDKFKQLVQRQDEHVRPETLGEPSEVTDWSAHIRAGHRIKNYTRIQSIQNGQKQALVHTPEANQYFLAIEEKFIDKYYYVWILCLTEGSDRILFRINAGDVQFVTWDIPAEDKK